MLTKHKQAKVTARRNKLSKERNVRLNQRVPPYTLYISVGASLRKAMTVSSKAAVDAHLTSMEDLRKRNASDIVEAVILETKTGKQIARVEGHEMNKTSISGVYRPALIKI